VAESRGQNSKDLSLYFDVACLEPFGYAQDKLGRKAQYDTLKMTWRGTSLGLKTKNPEHKKVII